MIEVIKYTSDKKEEWNEFIQKSKNGTFLFYRDFIEYHQDRFEDYSLMIYRNGRLISCLPANVTNRTEIHSHQGLTYGGFVFDDKIRIAQAEEVLNKVTEFYKKQGIKKIFLKQIPVIYHRKPSNEMDYWLWRKGAEVYRRDTTFTVDLRKEFRFSKRKIRYSRKAVQDGTVIKRDDKIEPFWNDVLIPNLERKYKVKPVHSVAEILMLKNKFPENIIQVNAYSGESVIAGTTLFVCQGIVHAQYIATSEEGKRTGALDHIFIDLIEYYKNNEYDYFDFGISNEKEGKVLNYSLAEFKEGFGAKVFIQDFYKLNL